MTNSEEQIRTGQKTAQQDAVKKSFSRQESTSLLTSVIFAFILMSVFTAPFETTHAMRVLVWLAGLVSLRVIAHYTVRMANTLTGLDGVSLPDKVFIVQATFVFIACGTESIFILIKRLISGGNILFPLAMIGTSIAWQVILVMNMTMRLKAIRRTAESLGKGITNDDTAFIKTIAKIEGEGTEFIRVIAEDENDNETSFYWLKASEIPETPENSSETLIFKKSGGR